MSYFLCEPYAQLDGSRYQTQNCVAATTVEVIDLGSVGRFRLTASAIRQTSGDTSGGLEYSIAKAAGNELTDNQVPLTVQMVDDWAEAKDILARSSAGLLIDCSKTIRTPFRTNYFTGLHSVSAAAGSQRDGTIKVEDPGTTVAGWKRWPLTLLRDASLVRDPYTGQRHRWLLVAPPSEDVNKNARIRVGVRLEPDRNSRRLGVLQKGDRIHVRATTTGGDWRRANGTTAHGWHVVDWRGGRAYCKGEGLR